MASSGEQVSAEHEDDQETLERYSAEAWMRYLKRDRSFIVDIFQGQLRSTIRCKACGHGLIRFDTFQSPQRELERSYRLRSWVSEMFQSILEHLQNDI